jgi:hypothetical protein
MMNELGLGADLKVETAAQKRSKWAFALAALGGGVALVVAAGCGSSSDDPYPDVQKFCVAKANAECKVAANVCDLTISDCLTAREAACNTDATQAQSEGRTYNSGLVPTCLNAVTTAYGDNDGNVTAQDYLNLTKQCERVFAGSAKADQACSNDYDCTGSLICDPIRKACGPSTTVQGGQPCNNPGDICASNFYCGQDTAPGAVAGLFTCLASPPTGGACSATILCGAGDYCATDVCSPELTSGESCSADDQCPSGDICDPYVHACDSEIRFAPGATACDAYSALTGGTGTGTGTTGTPDAGTKAADSGTTTDSGSDAGDGG